MRIPEEFLHYLWKNKLCGSTFSLSDGKHCRVVSPGISGNRDGPDFESAEIEIDGQRWLGFVEIHVKSSDWYRHFHHLDAVYDRIILHVVAEDDKPVKNNMGETIPTIVLSEAEKLFRVLASVQLAPKAPLLCHEQLADLPKSNFIEIVHQFAKARIDRKSKQVEIVFGECESDWNETAWRIVATVYGISKNVAPMEWLARSVGWKQLAATFSLFSIEAILLGQAGMLNKQFGYNQQYELKLQAEYSHLKNKYGLVSIDETSWKYSPIRPPAFPDIRIAQLAALVFSTRNFLQVVLEPQSLAEYYRIFMQPVSVYWTNRYRVGAEAILSKSQSIGKSSIDIFLLNAVVPFLIFYGKKTFQSKLISKAYDLLKEIEPEKNKIINTFVLQAGVELNSAFSTQGLIELYKTRCLNKKCMSCPVLLEIMSTKIHERAEFKQW